MLNELLPIQNKNATLTMTTREIAELTGKNHADVMRDARSMVERLQKADLLFVCNSISYIGSNGQNYPMYEMDYSTTMTLLLGYDPVARKKVVDRWQELERKNAVDPMVLLNDPVYLRGALQQFTERVIVLAPKAEAFDRLATKAEGSMNLTNAAKHLQIQPKKFNQFLSAQRWIYKRNVASPWSAYQDKLQAGYLEHKANVVIQPDGTEKVYPQVLVTVKGLAKLSEMLNKVAA